LSLRLKKSRTCAVKENDELDFSVADIRCHPNHNSSFDKQVDLALIKATSRIPTEQLNNLAPLCIENVDGINDLYEYAGNSGNFFVYGLGNPEGMIKNTASLSTTQVSLTPHFSCLHQFSSEGVDYGRNSNIFCMYSSDPEACVADPGSAIINTKANRKMIFAGITSSFAGKCGTQNSFIGSSKMQDVAVLKWASDIVAK